MKNNKYIKFVSERGITYSDKFKAIFIAEDSAGKLPFEIFRDAGFDIEVLGNSRIYSTSKRWRNAYKEDGTLGLRGY